MRRVLAKTMVLWFLTSAVLIGWSTLSAPVALACDPVTGAGCGMGNTPAAPGVDPVTPPTTTGDDDDDPEPPKYKPPKYKPPKYKAPEVPAPVVDFLQPSAGERAANTPTAGERARPAQPATEPFAPATGTPSPQPAAQAQAQPLPTGPEETDKLGTEPTGSEGGGGIPGGKLAALAAAGVGAVLLGAPPLLAKKPEESSEEPAPQEALTNSFRVRVRGGFSGSVGILGGTVVKLEVQEIRSDGPGRSRNLTFMGAGLSVGLKVGLSSQSEWEEIVTPSLTSLSRFGGVGGLGQLPQVGLGPAALNAGAGMVLNIGGPKGTGNVHVNPTGGGVGFTVIGAQGGVWW